MLWKENSVFIEGVQDSDVLKNKPKEIHMMKVLATNLCSDTLKWPFDQFFVLSQKFKGTIVNVFVFFRSLGRIFTASQAILLTACKVRISSINV